MWRWRLLRLLALVAGLAIAVVIYTQVRHDDLSVPTGAGAPSQPSRCDVYRDDSAVDLSFDGVDADAYCAKWVQQEGQAGEFWHTTDRQVSAGSSVKLACDLWRLLRSKNILRVKVFEATSNFGAPGADICAMLVGADWTEAPQ